MPGPSVDVWVDPICPFCYVAVERAGWLQERYAAQVRWHPFDLHPEYPPEGIPRGRLLARYGDGFHRQVQDMLEATGLPLGELPERVPSSRRAQRVALAAGERAGELLRRFEDAYWARGRDIGADGVIVEEALAAGLDEETVRQVLATDAHLDALLRETNAITEAGATGVPAWIVDERVLVPGAQPHEVFERVLARLGHPPA